MSSALLVGDVGGTNVRFALARGCGGHLTIGSFEMFAGDDYESFDAVLDDYLSRQAECPERACLALAGPIQAGSVHLTNRENWVVAESGLQERFGFGAVRLINDFHAMARAVPELSADCFEVISAGAAVADAPILVAGPGTGFGVATLLSLGAGRWRVLTGEGGHAAYAPREPLEFELLRILARGDVYVSTERVASGSGLSAVHAAFCEMFGRSVESLSPADMRARADAGDDMFEQLISLRAKAVMGAMGDLALITGALGGVVIAGGVAERIVDYLKRPDVLERFVRRGPMSHYLAHCPVRLMHSAEAPLIGAAAYFNQERPG